MLSQNNTPMGRCGFYCGCCPSFTAGQCSGCQKAHQRGDCFTRDCTEKRSLDFCPQCADFPCGELLRRSKATVLDRERLLWKRRQRG